MQPSMSSDDNQKNDETVKYCSTGRMAGKSLHAIAKKNVSDGDGDRQMPEASLHTGHMSCMAIVWGHKY